MTSLSHFNHTGGDLAILGVFFPFRYVSVLFYGKIYSSKERCLFLDSTRMLIAYY